MGVLALLLASFLGTTSPPSNPLSHVEEMFRQARAVDDVQLTIEVRPLRPGPNKIRLTVTGRDGHRVTDTTAALLQLQVGVRDGAHWFHTRPRVAGYISRERRVLGIEGRWRGQVTIQRQGAYDLNDRFELVLTSQTDQHLPSPSSVSMNRVTALANLGIVGVTLFLLLMSIRRLNVAIQRIAVNNQHQVSQSDRR